MTVSAPGWFSKTLWLSLSGLGVAAVCWALRDAASSRTAKAMGPSPALSPAVDTERVVAELNRAEMRLAETERRIAELERERQVRPLASGAAPGEDVAGNETQPAGAPAELSEPERRARVDATFAAEAVDSTWKPEAEVRSTLGGLLPAGASIRSIDCRRSLCRVETSHPNVENQRAYVQAVAMPNPTLGPRPFDGALFDEGTPSPDGRDVRSVTYLMRPGFEQP